MIIADTNVVSEVLRDTPSERVLAWLDSVRGSRVTVCAVTVFEIERGISRLPRGRRAEDLSRRWSVISRRFGHSLVAFDHDAAREAAAASAHAEASGRPMSLADAQITGCCLASGAILATRNTADFETVVGLRVVDPFA